MKTRKGWIIKALLSKRYPNVKTTGIVVGTTAKNSWVKDFKTRYVNCINNSLIERIKK